MFKNLEHCSRGEIHGDDFYVLEKVASVLNRVASLDRDVGQKRVQMKPDFRPVQLILEALDFDDETNLVSYFW